MPSSVKSRHLLVIASQCKAIDHLGGLTEAAKRLHDTLRDPQLGDCVPGLRSGESLLIINPRRPQKDQKDPQEYQEDTSQEHQKPPPLGKRDIEDKLIAAGKYAAEQGASLILALLGHGHIEANDPTLHFMAWDSDPELAEVNAVNVSGQIAKFLHGIDGVIAIIDTCSATAALPDKNKLIGGNLNGRTRLSMLMASGFEETARLFRFSSELDTVLRTGILGSGAYLDVPAIKHELTKRIKTPVVTALGFDGVQWKSDTDLGMWLAHNRQALDSWSDTLDVEWVQELTSGFCPTPAFSRLRHAITCERGWVEVRGPAGSGKSTLMAALTLSRLLGTGTASAMMFCTDRDSLASIAITVSAQLAVRLPAGVRETFVAARENARAAAADDRSLDAWQTDVLIPLAAVPELDVVIGIDGVDHLDTTSQRRLHGVIDTLLDRLDERVCVVTSTCSTGDGSAVSQQTTGGQQPSPVEVDPLSAQRITAWLSHLGEKNDTVRALTEREWQTDEDWLLARLLLDLARSGMPTADLPTTLQDAYGCIHTRAEDSPGPDADLATLREVLAATSTTPVPLTVVYEALRRADAVDSVPQLRDLLVKLRQVVIRIHPQTDRETIRPLHSTYSAYLTDRTEPQRQQTAHQLLLKAIEVLANDPETQRYARVARPSHVFGAGKFKLLVDAIDNSHQERELYAADRRDDWLSWYGRLKNKLPDTDSAMFEMRAKKARWLGESGDTAGAINEYRALLADQRRVPNPDHKDILQTRECLAHWTGEAGYAAQGTGGVEQMIQAATEYADLLSEQRSEQGDDHDDTLLALGEEAHWRGEAGHTARELEVDGVEQLEVDGVEQLEVDGVEQLERALVLYEELLEAQRRLGYDEQVLKTLDHIIHWAGETGDVPRALTGYREILEKRTQLLGSDHRETLKTRDHIAHWLGTSGEIDPAINEYNALLEDQLRVLGHDDKDVLHTRGRLADWLAVRNDPVRDDRSAAVAQLDALVPDYERVLGTDHSETAYIRSRLDYWRNQGNQGG